MMERVLEETKRRGEAQGEKEKIEAELDELSASLFGEANKMVAVERLARHRADEKSKQFEERLKDTEELIGEQANVVADLQRQLEEMKKKESSTEKELAQNGSLEKSTNQLNSTREQWQSQPELSLPDQRINLFNSSTAFRFTFN